MSDDDLRRLEREAAANDPQACLRLARACERAGRPVDALAALVRGADNVAVRREAARFPCDVAPLRAAPRVKWEAKLDGRDHVDGLAATPLAVVIGTRRRNVVLDPERGAVRHELPPGEVVPVEHALLVRLRPPEAELLRPDQEVQLHDAWTGALLHRARLPGHRRPLLVRGDLLVTSDGSDAAAFRLPDLARPPEPVWRHPGPGGRLTIERLTAERVVATAPQDRSMVVLDPVDGRQVFAAPSTSPVLMGGDDLLVRTGTPGLTCLSATDGAPRWSRPDPAEHPVGFAGDALVAVSTNGPAGELLRIDRRSGATLPPGPVALRPLGDPWDAQARVVGDVLYRSAEVAGLEACGLDGRVLWTRPPRPRPEATLVLPGRWLIQGGRALVCLAEGS